MYIKKILILTMLCLTITHIFSNPFHTSKPEEKVPVVRNAGGSSSEKIIKLQMDFRTKMADLLVELKSSKNTHAYLLLFFISFLYGAVHAAGPGHRKSVIFSIFISNKSHWWEPGLASIISAFIHGVSGVLLILIFKEFSTHLLSTRVDKVSKYMEAGSFSILMVMAFVLLCIKIISMIKSKQRVNRNQEKDKRGYFYTVLITSLVPCPGAILILLLALSLNVLNLGIIIVIFLSMGMGFTISVAGYLGWFGRAGLFKVIKSRENLIALSSDFIELIGYVFLLIFSGWMLMPALSVFI